MPESRTQQSGSDRQWVQRFLAAIIRNAELDADRVTAFLKTRGMKPRRKSKRPVPAVEKPTGQVAEILLNIAAALRLRTWERAGLTTHLPERLPAATDALTAAADCAVNPETTDNSEAQIPKAVFRTLIERFAQDGQVDLGTDVVLDAKSGDKLLDEFAAFLLAASNAMNEIRKKGPENGRTN